MKQFQHYLIERRDNNRAFYSHLLRDLRPLLRELQRGNECDTKVLFVQATAPHGDYPHPEDLQWDADAVAWGRERNAFLEEHGASWSALPATLGLEEISRVVQNSMREGSVIVVINRGDGQDLRIALDKQFDIHQTVPMPHYYRYFLV